MQAQTLTTISTGKPLGEEPMYNVLSISRNGKYVCGTTFDYAMFTCDWKSGTIFLNAADGETGAELRHVSDNGVAIGFNEDLGVLFDAEGKRTDLSAVPEGYKYFLGEDITADGTLKIGELMSNAWSAQAAYTKDGKEWTLLPAPTDEQAGYQIDGISEAKYVSGDGKVIAGSAGNFGPAVLWYQNADGNYTLDAICEKYFDATGEGTNPFIQFFPYAISGNGKYLLLQVADNDGSGSRNITMLPAVYNTETKEVKVYRNQELSADGMNLTPCAIADDGTIIGYIGDVYLRMGTFIIKSGEEQAKTFQQAFPNLAEQFTIYDQTSMHTPVGISADGRYITGYGVNLINMTDPGTGETYETQVFESYVLDTQSTGSSISTVDTGVKNSAPEYYSVDGRKLNGPEKGLNIMKYGDGTTRKVIVKQ